MQPLIVRAFPVRPRKWEELPEFARALETSREAEAAAFYAHYGVERERWHLQEAENGPGPGDSLQN